MMEHRDRRLISGVQKIHTYFVDSSKAIRNTTRVSPSCLIDALSENVGWVLFKSFPTAPKSKYQSQALRQLG